MLRAVEMCCRTDGYFTDTVAELQLSVCRCKTSRSHNINSSDLQFRCETTESAAAQATITSLSSAVAALLVNSHRVVRCYITYYDCALIAKKVVCERPTVCIC